MLNLTIGTWDPDYGPTVTGQAPDEPAPEVDVTVETGRANWAPIRPGPAARPGRVLFIDGVRRIDAALWATPDGATRPRQALAASYAAGIVACTPTVAEIEHADVRRILVGPPGLETLDLGAGAQYQPVIAGDDPTAVSLSNTIQERLGQLEQHIAHQATEADLTVIDGPLSARQQIPGAIGYVKTHQVAYLDAELEGTVAALGGGERTPMFLTSGVGGSGYTRLSFYLRLTSATPHPWAGIVRCELAPTQSIADATATADLIAGLLPQFASEPHWDPRAPQNLVPIAALEQQLRHLLGDQTVLDRRLRAALAA